jgi:hypothetical protein
MVLNPTPNLLKNLNPINVSKILIIEVFINYASLLSRTSMEERIITDISFFL